MRDLFTPSPIRKVWNSVCKDFQLEFGQELNLAGIVRAKKAFVSDCKTIDYKHADFPAQAPEYCRNVLLREQVVDRVLSPVNVSTGLTLFAN